MPQFCASAMVCCGQVHREIASAALVLLSVVTPDQGIGPDTLQLCASVAKQFPQQALFELSKPSTFKNSFMDFSETKHRNKLQSFVGSQMSQLKKQVREELSWAKTPVSPAILALLPKEV